MTEPRVPQPPSPMNLILHCTSRILWQAALDRRIYAPDSLRTEGFIHFSTPGQIVTTANRLFHGRPDLVLVIVNADALASQLRYENLDGGEIPYPHLYAPLDLHAVIVYLDFPPNPDGTFSLPAAIAALLP